METEPLTADTVDKSHIDPCPTKDCGATLSHVEARSVIGWTLAGVFGSGEPTRAYCTPHCARRGIARMHRLTIRPTDE